MAANGFSFIGRTFSLGGLYIVWAPVEQGAPAPGTSLNLSSTVTMIPAPAGGHAEYRVWEMGACRKV